MKILVIGANGYVGSTVAALMKQHGHDVAGLARNDEAGEKLKEAGLGAVPGTFTDLPGLTRLARNFDAVVFAPVVPFEEEVPALSALIDALEGTGKTLIYTSGTGVLSIPAPDGAWHQETFSELDPYVPQHWLSLRVDTENLVRNAGTRGVRGIVIRPPLIWGNGGSKQVPAIFESVQKTGSACYIGAGLNLYSHVHVDDLAELYRLALERGSVGALYHSVAGEVNWRTIAEAVAQVMNCPTRSVTFEEACEIWEPLLAELFFSVSSRSQSIRSRMELGWAPTKFDLIEDIRSGSYRAAYRPA